MQQPRYVRYTLPFPLAIQFSVMVLHCQTWHWGQLFLPLTHSGIYNTKVLHTKYVWKNPLVKNWAHFSCTLSWPESYLPCYCLHRTIPKCLEHFTLYFWSCCVSTSPSMTWKQQSCVVLHLKSAIFQSSDVNRTTLYHLQLNISAQQMWNTSSVSLLSLKPAT